MKLIRGRACYVCFIRYVDAFENTFRVECGSPRVSRETHCIRTAVGLRSRIGDTKRPFFVLSGFALITVVMIGGFGFFWFTVASAFLPSQASRLAVWNS